MDVHRDLIYDIGLHLGEDTAYYLAKGYRVVAVEADPVLAKRCSARFQKEIRERRLSIVQAAASSISNGQVAFYRNEDATVWGTSKEDWRKRGEDLATRSTTISVPTVSIGDLLNQHGCPVYMKLDIEGGERELLAAMLERKSTVPPFISIESEKVHFAALVQEIRMLKALGYRKFKIVQQACIPSREIETQKLDGAPLTYTFEEHASGAFGDDLPGRWLPWWLSVILYIPIFVLYGLVGDRGTWRGTRRGRLLCRFLPPHLPGWYDTHARR